MRATSSRLVTAALLVSAAGAWIWFRVHTGIVLEDALITYRYAANLAEGRGFVFNPGEPVLGTTTPLLAVILGALGALFGAQRIPLISNVLMISAASATALLTRSLARRLGYGRLPATLVMAIFCFHPDTLWTTVGGMETPLVLLLMAAGAWALATERWTLAGSCAALLALARIDGILWAAGIYAVILVCYRRALARALAAGAFITAPWVLFAFWRFGSPIPHSVIAKRVIGADYDLASPAHLTDFLTWITPHLGASSPIGGAAGLLLFVAGGYALLRPRVSTPLRRWLVLYPFVLCAAFYLGRAPLWFEWYLAPITWCALLIGGLGTWWLAEQLAALPERISWARWPSWIALACLGLLYATSLWQRDVEMTAFQRAYQINEDGTRRAAGEWLERNTPSEAVVAMEAVGYQAWYARRRVIDLAGLVSPQVVEARRGSATNAEAFHRILGELRPDYLVLRSFEVDTNTHYQGGEFFESNEQRATFWARYQEVKRFVAPLPQLWGRTAYLTIYRRVG